MNILFQTSPADQNYILFNTDQRFRSATMPIERHDLRGPDNGRYRVHQAPPARHPQRTAHRKDAHHVAQLELHPGRPVGSGNGRKERMSVRLRRLLHRPRHRKGLFENVVGSNERLIFGVSGDLDSRADVEEPNDCRIRQERRHHVSGYQQHPRRQQIPHKHHRQQREILPKTERTARRRHF